MGAETLIETFSRLRRKLHSAAISLLRDEMEAEDAVHDAFINLWSSRMPETDTEARNRLFLVLRNVCLNKLRSRHPSVAIESVDLQVHTDIDHDIERIKALVLRALTAQQRVVFELIVLRDMDYPEVATELGMTVEAVRMHMSRARKKIRELLTDHKI